MTAEESDQNYRISLPLQGMQPQLQLQWCCWYVRVSCRYTTTISIYCRKSEKRGELGFRLSIRMYLVEFPFICLGQDETIFKQYIFTKNMWTCKGICWLVPKDEGFITMISTFQYLELSFGYPLTVKYLQTVNKYCALHSWDILTISPSPWEKLFLPIFQMRYKWQGILDLSPMIWSFSWSCLKSINISWHRIRQALACNFWKYQ